MFINFSLSTALAISRCLNVRGASLKAPSDTCELTIFSTSSPIVVSLYSFRLRDAASTESAIITMASSLVSGSRPLYEKRLRSISLSG